MNTEVAKNTEAKASAKTNKTPKAKAPEQKAAAPAPTPAPEQNKEPEYRAVPVTRNVIMSRAQEAAYKALPLEVVVHKDTRLTDLPQGATMGSLKSLVRMGLARQRILKSGAIKFSKAS